MRPERSMLEVAIQAVMSVVFLYACYWVCHLISKIPTLFTAEGAGGWIGRSLAKIIRRIKGS